jgi:hypothetical protein
MRVGITGHQKREGISWNWVHDTLCAELERIGPVAQALSSLAEGADQVFAKCALDHDIELVAVIPFHDYESVFGSEAKKTFLEFLQHAVRLDLNFSGDRQVSFLKAGQYIVDNVDTLMAVWDGQPAEGPGGTADIVQYAIERSRPIIHIDPVKRTVVNR